LANTTADFLHGVKSGTGYDFNLSQSHVDLPLKFHIFC